MPVQQKKQNLNFQTPMMLKCVKCQRHPNRMILFKKRSGDQEVGDGVSGPKKARRLSEQNEKLNKVLVDLSTLE